MVPKAGKITAHLFHTYLTGNESDDLRDTTMHHQGSHTFQAVATAVNNTSGYSAGDTEIIVDSVDNLYVGDTITVDTETATIAAIDVATKTITLTAGLAGSVSNNDTVTKAAATTRVNVLGGTKLESLPLIGSISRTFRCRVYARAFGASNAALGVGMTHTLTVGGIELFADSEVPRQLIAGAANVPAVPAAFPSPDDIPLDEFEASSGDDIELDITATAAGVYRYRVVAVPIN